MRRIDIYQLTPEQRQQYVQHHSQFISTTTALADHEAWHATHGPGGMTGPGSGEHFLMWHRYFIRRLEDYLGAQGAHYAVPIPTWNPATAIPVELRARINNPNPNLPLPSWATIQGGSAPDPVFGYTSLRQFKSTDELGRALGANYHGQVHVANDIHIAVGGDMNTFASPRAPIFFPWHGFLDQVLDDWQQQVVVAPTLTAQGYTADPGSAGVRLNLYVRGVDGKLWERQWNGSAWAWNDTGREVLGRVAALTHGNIASVAGPDIRSYLFVQGADRKLWERYWNGAAWVWNDTGRTVDGEPVVIARGNLGSIDSAGIRIHLFVRGVDGKLWERQWNGSAWSWSDTGRAVAGKPAAVVYGDREDVGADDIRIRLFVRGADGKLWERYWNGSAWSWLDAGKEVVEDPIVLAQGSLGSTDESRIRLLLFVKGKDGKLWERYWNGSTWAWKDHGRGIVGRPAVLVHGNTAAVSSAGVRISLFVQGSDGKLWEHYWNGSAWTWRDTGRAGDGEPIIIARGNLGAVDRANVRLHVFTRSLEYETTGHAHYHVKLWEHVWNGTGWGWRDTGREVAGQPVAIVRGDVGGLNSDDLRINLFVTGTDRKLWEHVWNGTGWSWNDAGRAVAT
ncbi:MAG: tyrosinase family protein [Chloroflexi bacterium]|nr:tyrosinase family protein [Chloroflexota bacterium]